MNQCRVSQDLNNYELKQELLEKQWGYDLANKQEAVIELAKKILSEDTDTNTFDLAFQSFRESDDEWEILISSLEQIQSDTISDQKMAEFLVGLALDAAAYCLYSAELQELYSDDCGEKCMINRVLS